MPPRSREAAERAARVGSGQRSHAGRNLFQRLGRDEHATCTALHGLRDEIAAVEIRAFQRDEEAVRDRLARIGEDAFEGPARRRDSRARRPRRLFEREEAHRSISCSARRASARSSNGRFSVPTIW